MMKTKLLLTLVICFATFTEIIYAQPLNVLTQHYTSDRLGANLNETKLTTTNVSSASFGKLYSYPADGHLYAQPLYVAGLNIPGKGLRNILYIATQHNTIYAYDADSLTKPIWQESVGTACPLPDPVFGYRYGPYHDIKVEVGITSTPVIDLASNTIYIVAFTKEGSNYYHRLHALDIRTGEPKVGSPTLIQASVIGTGDGSVGGIVTFDSKQQLQRSSLLLSNGVVYFAFAGYADTDPYHGWLLGYDAATLAQKYVFNVTPNGGEGGIWMSGEGPSVDANGNIYLITGNGDYSANTGGKEYSDSYLKFTPNGTSLTVTDYFTPYNQAYLSSIDADLGVDGAILLPGTNLIVGGSKEGKIYVVDRTNMGGYNTTACNCDNQIVQSFFAFNGHLHGSLVYWDGPTGKHIYGWSEDDTLKSFKLNGSLFDPIRDMKGNVQSPGGMPGGILSVSANGSTAGSGIIWANIPLNANANPATVNGILRAYDASDLSVELWNSEQNSTRDGLGYFAKFNSPVVVNGKVYHSTFSNQLVVYGLNPPSLWLREPENPPGAINTINYNYYTGAFTIMPPYSALTPDQKGTSATFNAAVASATTNYALNFTGFIYVPIDGLYTFYTSSDDGSQLFIGNQLIVNNDGAHGNRERQGSIGLKAGTHMITVNYFQGTGGQAFSVSYQGPTIPKTIIPAGVLYRVPPPIASASASPSPTICEGNTVHLSTTANAGESYRWYKDGNKLYDYLATYATYDATTAGDYSVVVSNGGGADTSTAITIIVNQTPTSLVITGNTIVLGNAVEQYNISTQTGSSYNWSITGGNPDITSGSQVTVTWGNGSSGIVSITETDINTCQTTSSESITITTNPLSILDGTATKGVFFLNTYPNPTNNFASIDFGALEGESVKLELFTSTGSKILSLFDGISSGNGKIKFSTDNLLNGVYICRLQSGSTILNNYIVVIK